jgi:hypothetical protein
MDGDETRREKTTDGFVRGARDIRLSPQRNCTLPIPKGAKPLSPVSRNAMPLSLWFSSRAIAWEDNF